MHNATAVLIDSDVPGVSVSARAVYAMEQAMATLDPAMVDALPGFGNASVNASYEVTLTAAPRAEVTVRFSRSAGDLDGSRPHRAASSCRALLESHPDTPSGVYWVEPSSDGQRPFEVSCDMVTDGGGWYAITLDSSVDAIGGVILGQMHGEAPKAPAKPPVSRLFLCVTRDPKSTYQPGCFV